MRSTLFYAVLMAFVSSVAVTADSAYAVVVKVGFENDPDCCDDLFVPEVVDELGRGNLSGTPSPGYPFPLDETIRVAATFTDEIACADKDDPKIMNAFISITNLTSPAQSFSDVWYVGNPTTQLSNVDGYVVQKGYESLGKGRAFQIDNTGKNTPLVSESMNPDGIFEPGETWLFIVQDFFTGAAGPTADEISSIGVAGGSLGSSTAVLYQSSGSIIALPIPEPSVAMLLGSALVALVGRGRRIRR